MLVAKKILVIDDSATVRQQVRKALGDASFEVVEAEDGVEGLEAILGRQDLAAVLCDVNMPRLGGLEMLEMLNAKGKTATFWQTLTVVRTGLFHRPQQEESWWRRRRRQQTQTALQPGLFG